MFCSLAHPPLQGHSVRPRALLSWCFVELGSACAPEGAPYWVCHRRTIFSGLSWQKEDNKTGEPRVRVPYHGPVETEACETWKTQSRTPQGYKTITAGQGQWQPSEWDFRRAFCEHVEPVGHEQREPGCFFKPCQSFCLRCELFFIDLTYDNLTTYFFICSYYLLVLVIIMQHLLLPQHS